MKPIIMKKKKETGCEFERCVLCGAETPFRRSTPVGLRTDYVEGAGQLCRRCAASIRGEEQYAMQNDYVYEIPYFVKAAER